MKVFAWTLFTVIAVSIWTWQQIPDGNMHLTFCDVGQGDAALISYGYFQALIDTGEGEAVLECIGDRMPFWDRKIEVVFISHPDSDHAGALEEIKRSYEIGKTINTESSVDIVRNRDLLFDIVNKGNNGVDMVGEACSSDNECSLVIRVVFKNFSSLFTGDIGMTDELALIESGVIKESDILKVAHHGSKFSSSPEFLEAVSPKLAVISVGAKNRYGHPAGDTLMRLDTFGVRVLRTDKDGDVEIVTDGEKTWVAKK